jgi:hypothetical protein
MAGDVGGDYDDDDDDDDGTNSDCRKYGQGEGKEEL